MANRDDNTVSELDASTGSVIQTITVGSDPLGVSSDGTHVWVTNSGSNRVSEIDSGGASGFRITTSSFPCAAPGVAYGPVTLQEAGAGTSVSPYVTTLKWRKVNLPKGLKLSKDGMLSGTPNKKLAAVTVQVTETVTTLNGKKKDQDDGPGHHSPDDELSHPPLAMIPARAGVHRRVGIGVARMCLPVGGTSRSDDIDEPCHGARCSSSSGQRTGEKVSHRNRCPGTGRKLTDDLFHHAPLFYLITSFEVHLTKVSVQKSGSRYVSICALHVDIA